MLEGKECAKAGSAITSAHLWASWTEIVHFPSESICRPIIRIILGTSSGHCILSWIYLSEPQPLPWTQTIAPQRKVNTKLIMCYIPLWVTTTSNGAVNQQQESIVNIQDIVIQWLWTCAPCLLLGNTVAGLEQKVWMRNPFENKTC